MNQPITQTRIKVFAPGNKKFKTTIVRRKGHTVNVEGLLENVAETIEKHYPGEEYSMVQVGKDAYNFVHRGNEREAA